MLLINKADQIKIEAVTQASEQAAEEKDELVRKTSKVRGLNMDKDAKLPIVFHEREIMETLTNNIVTIVCGETGSGKSTQLPQFIYKARENGLFRT